MTAEMVPADTTAAIVERVVVSGDLAKLTPAERVAYYAETCKSLGLNPLTRPFEYITLNGKLTLYATRGAADQLRALRGITITHLEPREVGELLVVVATGRDATGREDSATGAVSTKGLAGEALANAMMKAETKAKRRLTLSLAGLGWADETEVASIPNAVPATVDADTGEVYATRSESVKARLGIAQAPDPEPVEAAGDERAAILREWAEQIPAGVAYVTETLGTSDWSVAPAPAVIALTERAARKAGAK